MSKQPTRLCLVLHNHQPVGNFDDVFEAAYQDSYLPFLDVFQPYEHLRISLHTSGPLALWLLERHPEYVERISELVSQGRIEIIGGPFHEPILTMIPGRDRQGQILHFTDWLEKHFGGVVQGMWMPERVWESGLTSDLAMARMQYTILDDYHFRRAGLTDEQLNGYFVTENEGQILKVFPGSERLRYLIPFSEPEETIAWCREVGERQPGSVIVFGDDGEKFGTWPNTREHVYDNEWLKRFFDALTENRSWLSTLTLADAVAESPPRGKVYLPDASYREMTEWAMPVSKQIEYDDLVHEMENEPWWSRVQPYLAGGYWRNFKVKYPETNEMYARMMYVSQLWAQSQRLEIAPHVLERARDHLYQGQCNCSYWHGAFGGIYLPHLRNAVYRHLITAESLLERSLRGSEPWIEATGSDYDFDGLNEVRLANDKLVSWISPHRGGTLYELDIRELGHNLLATMQRRPESYHEKVRRGENESQDDTASIHDRVVFKQQGLEDCLVYDDRLRKSMIDHFWDETVNVQQVASNEAMERGDFADGQYEATIRRNPDRIQVLLKRQGNTWGVPLSITKGLTLEQGSSEIEIAYLIEGLQQDARFHFGVEFNFAGMPDGQDDRYFSDSHGVSLGQLGSTLDLEQQQQIRLSDDWLGLSVALHFDQVGGLWAFPIRSVSQSESGFELVHQSVVVQPHWIVQGDRHGRWSTRMRLSLETHSSDNQRMIHRMLALT